MLRVMCATGADWPGGGQVLLLVISGKSPKLSENTEKRYAQIRSRSTGSITTSDGFRCDLAANQPDFNAHLDL